MKFYKGKTLIGPNFFGRCWIFLYFPVLGTKVPKNNWAYAKCLELFLFAAEIVRTCEVYYELAICCIYEGRNVSKPSKQKLMSVPYDKQIEDC